MDITLDDLSISPSTEVKVDLFNFGAGGFPVQKNPTEFLNFGAETTVLAFVTKPSRNETDVGYLNRLHFK
jgi:hypothetical protein